MRLCWANYLLWFVIAVVGVGGLLAGCGSKGPLYLPKAPQQQTQQGG